MTRKEAIEILKAYRDKLSNSASNQLDKDIKAFDIAINSLEIDERYELEYGQTVICPSHGIDCKDCPAYESKTDVLDKIRAEILKEKDCAYADFERYKVEYLGQDWEDVLDSLPQDDFRYGMERVIDIIDNYKAESGGEE